MKVICIDDDFTKTDSEVVKNILKVGDDELLPKKGEIYEVLGYASFLGGIEAYIIDIPSSEAYGKRLCFKKERFEIYDDTFVPNSYDKKMDCPVRIVELYMEMKF
jgi:hypothetical protein